MRPLLASVVVLVLVLAASVGVASATHSALAQQEVVDTFQGAQYALFVPSGWNGRLVVYAHGFFDPEAPLALPDVAAPPDVAEWVAKLREALLQSGYAVAYSSYSENGWAVGGGAMRTIELPWLFARHFGKPDRTYLIGRSLGGLISLMLVEKSYYLQSWALPRGALSWALPRGALALCAPVGGGQLQADYIGNLRVLFDYYFPGVIPGNVLNPGDEQNPAPVDYATLMPQILAAIGANPPDAIKIGRALALASVDQIKLPFTNITELVTSFVRALGYNVRGAKDLVDRTRGGSPFDNTQTIYTRGGTPDPALNAGVGRFKGDSRGTEYLLRFYQPKGRFKVPVLTLHTTLDPDVPFSHEQALANIVAEEETSQWLVQQHYNRYGHCGFSPAEAASAFIRLVNWAENGEKPVSGVLP